MAEHVTHGTARQYGRGCRCLCCRAAYAAYRQRSRWLQAHHRPRRVAVLVARRLLRTLETEGWTRGRIAHALGRRWPSLRLGTQWVQARTLAKLRRLVED